MCVDTFRKNRILLTAALSFLMLHMGSLRTEAIREVFQRSQTFAKRKKKIKLELQGKQSPYKPLQSWALSMVLSCLQGKLINEESSPWAGLLGPYLLSSPVSFLLFRNGLANNFPDPCLSYDDENLHLAPGPTGKDSVYYILSVACLLSIQLLTVCHALD